MTMLDNAAYLNAAHNITGLGFIINTDYWYWSCSDGFSNYSWYCGIPSGRVYLGWYYKGYTSWVVPFYASTQAKKKKSE